MSIYFVGVVDVGRQGGICFILECAIFKNSKVVELTQSILSNRPCDLGIFYYD
jgi:hypothetical protein